MFGLGRKRKAPPQLTHAAMEPARRNRQQNIKVSEECSIAFAALAKAHGISKAALFEDMVAERFEAAQRQGIGLKV
jgi:hypothetical protein